jgi:hypothetical protein
MVTASVPWLFSRRRAAEAILEAVEWAIMYTAYTILVYDVYAESYKGSATGALPAEGFRIEGSLCVPSVMGLENARFVTGLAGGSLQSAWPAEEQGDVRAATLEAMPLRPARTQGGIYEFSRYSWR